MNIDNLKIEYDLLEAGYRYICGVDEVGRGPLAGSVVCCAIIMDLNSLVDGVTDSKKLSEKKRNSLYDKIISRSIAFNIAEVSPEIIDEINILQATKLCMQNAVNGLSVKPNVLLVDALKLQVDMEQKSIIKGDLHSYTIGSASIIAKVYRDNLMREFAKIYPQYGFEKHKGYGTAQHINALHEFGSCSLHRKTFIKNFI